MQISLPPPIITCSSQEPIYQTYSQGIIDLWKKGRQQRLYVSVPLHEFLTQYIIKAQQLAKQPEYRWSTLDPLTLLDPNLLQHNRHLFDDYEGCWDPAPSSLLGNIHDHFSPISLAVRVMRNHLEFKDNDNPKGTHENFSVHYISEDTLASSPTTIIDFSDGGDWDYPLAGFHYPAPLPDGGWEIAEYVSLSDNFNLKPSGNTWGYSDDDEEEDFCNLDDALITHTPTCDELALVFKHI